MRKQATGYVAGTWNADCDICGFTFRSTQIKLQWDGLRVCNDCHSHRHPQEFLRGVADRQSPPWTRPAPPPNQPFANDGGTDVDPATDL